MHGEKDKLETFHFTAVTLHRCGTSNIFDTFQR